MYHKKVRQWKVGVNSNTVVCMKMWPIILGIPIIQGLFLASVKTFKEVIYNHAVSEKKIKL